MPVPYLPIITISGIEAFGLVIFWEQDVKFVIEFIEKTTQCRKLAEVAQGKRCGGWEAVFYVDNLTDEEAIYSYSDALAFNIEDYDRTVRNRPRTIGASFSYSF